MGTTKTIAIIGAAGNMGSAIARNLSRSSSNRLLLMGSDVQKLENLQSDIVASNPNAEADVVRCPKEASWEADIIIIAAPYQADKQIAEKIKDVATGKIVVSISNPLNDDFSALLTPAGRSAAEELQVLLPNSKIVKAFNTTFAADFAQPVIEGNQIDSFIAGNDKAALESVQQLVRDAGFNPIVAGDLSVSRTLEQMQLMLIQLGIKNNYNWHAGFKILHV
jgi:8-hydroxy-5-deazaflavin:NADPH oxidoreductase